MSTASDLAFYARALKAPRIPEAAAAFAAKAREEDAAKYYQVPKERG